MPFVIHFLFVLLNTESIFETPAFSYLKKSLQKQKIRGGLVCSYILHFPLLLPTLLRHPPYTSCLPERKRMISQDEV